MNAGLSGFLVRTGKYREEFVRESGIEPTATIDSIADAAGPARGLSAVAGEVGDPRPFEVEREGQALRGRGARRARRRRVGSGRRAAARDNGEPDVM